MLTDEGSGNTPEVPRALKIVALLFAASGLINVAEMALNMTAGRFNIEFGLLNFWIAAGLLRFDRKWLKWAKRFIWFDLIAVDLLTLATAFAEKNPKFRFATFSMEMSDPVALVLIMSIAGVALWKLRVLKRPEIEELFVEEPARPFIPSRRFAPKPDLAIPEPAFDSSALAGRPRDANTRWQTKLDPEIREAAPLPASRPGDPRST